MSPKKDMTLDLKSNPGSGSGSGGQGDRGEDTDMSPPPPGSPGMIVGDDDYDDDDDDDDLIIIVGPPAPAAPVPSVGDTAVGKQAPGVGGGAGEGTSTARGKKRGRPPKAKEPMVADQGALMLVEDERPRKKAEFDAPEVPRPCSVCGKIFNNYKALFGHMRSHPGRLWRGAYPPPISPSFSPALEIQHEGEHLAASLLSIGERLILGDDPDEVGDDGAGASGSQPPAGAHPRGLDIDLNVEPVLSDPPSPEMENAEPERKEIDLNEDPSDEGEGDRW